MVSFFTASSLWQDKNMKKGYRRGQLPHYAPKAGESRRGRGQETSGANPCDMLPPMPLYYDLIKRLVH